MITGNRKKFYIGVDCEGISCVVGLPKQGLSSTPNYAFAAKQATREANAAARALFDCGAEEVIVWDNHHTGVNLDYDQLDSRCRIALGSGHKVRFPLIDESFGGVLFIGYHAHAGTRNAVLSHTYSSSTFQDYQINGMDVGEMEIDAAFAAEYGVPPIFASSDHIAVSQAKSSFPWIETVAIKEALSWNSAICLHPEAAQEAIYQGVTRACERLDEMKPFRFTSPLSLRIRFNRMDEANASQLYDMNRVPFAFEDAFTRVGTIARITDLFN